jgi:hypothetical protein
MQQERGKTGSVKHETRSGYVMQGRCKALGTSRLTSQNSRVRAEDKPPYMADSDHVRHTPLCAGMSQKYEHRIIK